ncbi:inositol hexakisphosphate and diphosphoinositol-pentakisphosphate kinase isoform X7 [Microplitis mediator]|uniref:inositol hexakisphosphate and diphosphoinositol-pentakisphosphate kinase isoform X7 n=1 Tax=Microplitis mediator TaxID=375433 RepID=UPI00255525AB|nr:inositol hexakisphosphate and diphosphoinositol-pentakisphosphate kinase isoform X7 [Microplitis mediator]
MSYTELEHGYQDLRSTSRPIFYVGDIESVSQNIVGAVPSSVYRPSKRGELSDGCDNDDGCMVENDLEGEGKQVLVGICAMAKKSQSKPMKEILTRLEEFEYIKVIVFAEDVILKEPVEDWPIVDCLISFHSKGFPLDKAISYANLRNPFIINNLPMQYDIQDRRRVYAILESEGIEIPRYAVLDRDSADPKHFFSDHELVESEDHVEVNGVTFNKPFVEKPVSAEDHNIYIYYPTSAGGGSQRLFRKIGSRSSVYSPESRVRKTGSYIYEDFMPTDGTDVKVYTVGPDYAHAEARKSPALDGKVERDSEGKEIRYPVILSNVEKLISRKVCLAFKQTVCGFDLLSFYCRANGKSFVCDVNGFSFVKNSNKYYDDCAKILGNMILRELAPTLHIPWSVPFQLDDPPIVPTTFGKMMELRCVVAVIRHGDRTPKQKMKVEVRHPKFFEIFKKYDGYKHGHVKLKRPKQLQEILDTARSLLAEIQHRAAGPELEEKQGKLEQLKSVLEMYGHFSGINRKVQMKYQPRGRPRGSSSDDGNNYNRLGEPSLVLILKWGGELTPAGRIQAEELGRIFRCMYPGGQGRHLSGEYAGAQGLGLLRLHSTFRHDLKIYASDEGRVQMTAAAFAKGLLALEGELTPILVQMVKSANTNGLLDNDCDSSKYQNMVKTKLHELLQQDKEFTKEDREQINPGNAISINDALDFVKNPVKCCQHVQMLIHKLMDIVRIKKDDPKTKDAILYHGETWELMGRRWGKIEKDFCTKNKRFDISKIPDIYDCIKYDLQHNNHTLQFDHAEELYIYAKYLADIVIPQEYGLTVQEKLTIGQGICTPLLRKIRADLQRNIEESGDETVNRLNPRYSHGVSSPGRHVRTRLYFTSESHVHSLLTVLRYGGLLDMVKDEQWRRAMEYVSMVSELNYMSQIVVMLYEDPTKDPSSEERFHVELHFSPGVNCCVQKNLPPGPGFRPHSRNESSHNLQETSSQCNPRIDEEDDELGPLDDDLISPPPTSDPSPPLIETDQPDSTLGSPTTSRAIDMMDLDPNMMDEPYDSGFLQSSAPIPISARTVAGHEAARLGSQLAASQRQRREREAANICEPRARSYDHQRQDKPEKTAEKLQYQSLDAVNREDGNSRTDWSTRSIKSHSSATPSASYHKNQTPETKQSRKLLGIPVILPHTLSSPDLPAPLKASLDCHSGPLITLHNTSLGSPTSGSPTAKFFEQPIIHQQKRTARSQSTLVLPRLDVPPGELLIKPHHHDHHQDLHQVPSVVKKKKRSRSLSPCQLQCNCYNCNVSELIHQDLSPSERINLHTYFNRSLSRKFTNCSCYQLNNININNCCNNNNINDDKKITIDSTSEDVDNKNNKKSKSYRKNSLPVSIITTESTKHVINPTNFNCKLLLYDNYECYDTNVSMANISDCKHDTVIKNKPTTAITTTISTITSTTETTIINSLSKLQTQRSLSSPDTRPTIIQPNPTCTARRHRHSISGQMSYFKLLGYNVSKKLTGSANSLFSTAVISGSSSAPNLKDMVPAHASAVAAIEGFGGVPPIRPLETLHNALSLRQLDSFLEMMTSSLFRTPASSPPKISSPGIHSHSLVPSLAIGAINRDYHPGDLEPVRFISPGYKGQDSEATDHRNISSPTSPNSLGWSSGPQSFLSSEPSSPAPTSTGGSSMSMSLISNDGQGFTGPTYSTTPCIEMDFNDFCMAIDQDNREGRGSISYTDYYSNEDGIIRKAPPKDNDDGEQDQVDDEEDHTLTLRQNEEQKKQDIKSIFDQKESLVKPGSSFKKIGRFRVESTEISDDDVRIKEIESRKPEDLKKYKINSKIKKGKLMSRSQSVSNAQTDNTMGSITEIDRETMHYSSTSSMKVGSFSITVDKDLNNWKNPAEPQVELSPSPSSPLASSLLSSSVTAAPSVAADKQEEPIVVVANSVLDKSSFTIGFDVDDDSNDKELNKAL